MRYEDNLYHPCWAGSASEDTVLSDKGWEAADLAAEACATEGIRQGLEDLAAGRTRSAREVFDELRVQYRISRAHRRTCRG